MRWIGSDATFAERLVAFAAVEVREETVQQFLVWVGVERVKKFIETTKLLLVTSKPNQNMKKI